MAGIPLFFGFIAKEQFYESVRVSALPGVWSGILVALAVGTSMCLGAAGFIAGIAPFRGRSVTASASHDAPASLWLGPIILGAIGVVLGVLPALVAGPVTLAAAAVTGAVSTVTFVLWHGFNTTLVLSMLTLAGAVGLFALRTRLWRLRWPAALHAERLYSFTVSALDAVGRRVAPALQSASLRSYVLTVVATAIALVTLALAADGALPPPRRWTPVAIPRRSARGAHRRGSAHGGVRPVADGRGLIAGYGRVRGRRALRAPRRTGPRDDPVRSRDADRRHLRARVLPVARVRRSLVYG